MIYSLLLFYLFHFYLYFISFYLYFISFYLYFISFYLYFTYSYLHLRFCFVTSFYILFSSLINSINCGKQSERLQVSVSCSQVVAESGCVTTDCRY